MAEVGAVVGAGADGVAGAVVDGFVDIGSADADDAFAGTEAGADGTTGTLAAGAPSSSRNLFF